MFCWGNHRDGRLGRPHLFSGDVIRVAFPLVDDVRAVVVEGDRACAIALAMHESTVFCWGDNKHFQTVIFWPHSVGFLLLSFFRDREGLKERERRREMGRCREGGNVMRTLFFAGRQLALSNGNILSELCRFVPSLSCRIPIVFLFPR